MKIKKLNSFEKWLNSIFNSWANSIQPVDSINLGKVGYTTKANVPIEERPKQIKFSGEGPAKAWFENSPNGIGYFNQDLYNKIKDYHKNT